MPNVQLANLVAAIVSTASMIPLDPGADAANAVVLGKRPNISLIERKTG